MEAKPGWAAALWIWEAGGREVPRAGERVAGLGPRQERWADPKGPLSPIWLGVGEATGPPCHLVGSLDWRGVGARRASVSSSPLRGEYRDWGGGQDRPSPDAPQRWHVESPSHAASLVQSLKQRGCPSGERREAVCWRAVRSLGQSLHPSGPQLLIFKGLSLSGQQALGPYWAMVTRQHGRGGWQETPHHEALGPLPAQRPPVIPSLGHCPSQPLSGLFTGLNRHLIGHCPGCVGPEHIQLRGP